MRTVLKIAKLKTVDDGIDDLFTHLRGRDSGGIYDELVPLYMAMYSADSRIHTQMSMVAKCARPTTAKVCELGCGHGALLSHLQAELPTVIGVDTSREMCRYASDTGAVIRSTAQAIAPSSINLTAAMGTTIGHILPDQRLTETLDAIVTHLHPGGKFICTLHDTRSLPESHAPPYERSQTTTTERYQIRQHDHRKPATNGEFEWHVKFDVTRRSDGDTVTIKNTTSLRSFRPTQFRHWLSEAGFEQIQTYPRRVSGSTNGPARAFVASAEKPA